MAEFDATEVITFTYGAAVNSGLFFSAILLLLMQPALFLFQVGSASRLNAINDYYKGVINLGAGALAFQLVGWDIVTGQSALTPLLAQAGFADADAAAPSGGLADESLRFLLHLGFAATAASICSGASAGRMRPQIFSAFAIGYAGVAYPILAFTVWHPQGLLYGEFTDFAGSVVVHGMGATSALAATMILRPRIGFNGYDPIGLGREQLYRLAKRHAPHSIPLAILGGLLVWICWIGLTAGAFFAQLGPLAEGGAGAALSSLFGDLGAILRATLLAPSAAAMVVVATQIIFNQYRDAIYTLRAAIAGAVAVSAGADLYGAGAAILVGVGAGALFLATSDVYRRLNIDDPVASIAAHGPAGVFGVAAAGFMSDADPIAAALLQAAYGLVLFALMFVATLAFFYGASLVTGAVDRISGGREKRERGVSALRVSHSEELQGVDVTLHGQDAYGAAPPAEPIVARHARAAAR